MDPSFWQQVEHALDAALALPASDRSAFLDKLGDIRVRAEVESLLRAELNEQSLSMESAIRHAAESLTATLANGATLGRFQVVRLLGAGGMGEVYSARDLKLDRLVALKVLPRQFMMDPDRVRRFEREARATARLNHPNIMNIFEIEEADGRQFLVCELVEGETLRSLLKGGALDISAALRIAGQIASALSAAHDVGIVHRDIKPENVMIRPDGTAKVLDFGLARVFATHAPLPGPRVSHTAPGAVMGTAAYLSPEQARGEEVDGRTDLWSLGVVLFEMLTGQQPFEGKTGSDLLVSILSRPPRPMSGTKRKVPKTLEMIVRKLLSKDRDDRFVDARAAGLALGEVKLSPRRYVNQVAALGLSLAILVPGVLWLREPDAISGPTAVETPVLDFRIVARQRDNAVVPLTLEALQNGLAFRFEFGIHKPGCVYLIQEESGSNRDTLFSILFPGAEMGKERRPAHIVTAKAETPWYRFFPRTGRERIWVIWAAEPVGELEMHRSRLNETDLGRIENARDKETMRLLLAQHAVRAQKGFNSGSLVAADNRRIVTGVWEQP